MSNKPLLPLPSPVSIEITKGKPKVPPKPQGQGYSRQSERLGPKFDYVEKALAASDGLALQADPSGIAPERALVFEAADSIERLAKAVASIDGLELLFEEDLEFEADDDFKSVRRSRDSESGEVIEEEVPTWGGRLYLMMPNVSALREILALWNRYKSGERKFPRGRTAWRDLFDLLRDVRVWGPQDRVSDSTIKQWEEDLSISGNRVLRFEAELWSSSSEARRKAAMEEFSKAIADAGGKVISTADIPEICYLAALAELDGSHLALLKEREGKSIDRLNPVMYLLPQTHADVELSIGEDTEEAVLEQHEDLDSAGSPRVVLLDGVPIQNHVLLKDRLIVDDPNGFEADTPVAARQHGTSMASLILHGDRANSSEEPLQGRLHVRPILKKISDDSFSPNGPEEGTPEDRLFVDLIHCSVREILDSDGDNEPTCPDALVFNFSVGERNRPFFGITSPLARLLDYLSFKYSVLFIVSAGNIIRGIPLKEFSSIDEFKNESVENRAIAVFRALDDTKWDRTILSPAESVNAFTVGAAHRDSLLEREESAYLIDPFESDRLPNLSSAVGLGVLKSVKPDALEVGGREHIRINTAEGSGIEIQPVSAVRNHFGVKSACSSPEGGNSRETFFSGTSVAAALATRSAAKLISSLEDMLEGGYFISLTKGQQVTLLKALLCHSTAWGEAADFLADKVFLNLKSRHFHLNENISRYLGHGLIDVERVLSCIDTRATLVFAGDIGCEEAREFEVPLPPSLAAKKDYRRLLFTVAWLTPVNSMNRNYRGLSLVVKPSGDPKEILGIERTSYQPYERISSRGTIFHDLYEGERAVAFQEVDSLKFRIDSKTTMPDFSGTVPFAVAVTVEVEEGSTIPVYNEIRESVMARITTKTKVR